MSTDPLPVPFAKAVMSLMPAPVLARGVRVVMQRMEGRHPKLFKNLASLQPARVHLIPTDLPHAFALTMGQMPVVFELLADRSEKADAAVSGPLQALVDMLEGRVDGDQLFFARGIKITGDTSVIVALRNTMDREEIDLYADITSLCGPFAAPTRKAIALLDGLARRVRGRVNAAHEAMHEAREVGDA